MATEAHAYAAYPSAVAYKEKVAGARKGKKPVQQVIWGDWIRILKKDGDWRQVRARGETGWMHKDDLQDERLLEVNFVDVGQGDGCHVVTPKDKHLLIDAGEGDNMYRFLNWRFRGFKKKFTFDAAVISHPDMDHYNGFKKLFRHSKVSFHRVTVPEDLSQWFQEVRLHEDGNLVKSGRDGTPYYRLVYEGSEESLDIHREELDEMLTEAKRTARSALFIHRDVPGAGRGRLDIDLVADGVPPLETLITEYVELHRPTEGEAFAEAGLNLLRGLK